MVHKESNNVSSLMLKWFDSYGYSYPFRFEDDPYKIFVSVIMLRQTTVNQVKKVYPIFIQRYPTLDALSKAQLHEVQKLIKSLGITSRANILINAANDFLKYYNGIIPNSYSSLIKINGINDYTANCILSLSFGNSQPMIDSNIKRVLSRVYMIDEKNDAMLRDKYMEIAPKISKKNIRTFFYSLIDLAHIICKKQPICNKCPIEMYCCKNIK